MKAALSILTALFLLACSAQEKTDKSGESRLISKLPEFRETFKDYCIPYGANPNVAKSTKDQLQDLGSAIKLCRKDSNHYAILKDEDMKYSVAIEKNEEYFLFNGAFANRDFIFLPDSFAGDSLVYEKDGPNHNFYRLKSSTIRSDLIESCTADSCELKYQN